MTDVELLKDAISTLNSIMLPVGLKQQIEQIGGVAYNLQLLLEAIEANIKKAQAGEDAEAGDEAETETEGIN